MIIIYPSTLYCSLIAGRFKQPGRSDQVDWSPAEKERGNKSTKNCASENCRLFLFPLAELKQHSCRDLDGGGTGNKKNTRHPTPKIEYCQSFTETRRGMGQTRIRFFLFVLAAFLTVASNFKGNVKQVAFLPLERCVTNFLC